MVIHIKNPEIKILYLGSNGKKNSEKDLKKIEAMFAEMK